MTPELLFDAARPGASFVTNPLVLLFAAGLLVAAVIAFRKRRRSDDPVMEGAHNLMIVLSVVALFGFAGLNLWQAFSAGRAAKTGDASVVQGCLRDYDRIVHPNGHNVTDIYFAVAGRDFHFNSSLWLPGYHEAGETIHRGDRLRILMHGNKVVRIERLGSDCPA